MPVSGQQSNGDRLGINTSFFFLAQDTQRLAAALKQLLRNSILPWALRGKMDIMTPDSLVHPLFDGPIDILGDIHGEIEGLLALLHHLGYAENGIHPQGRRLVFVGDLTDRGPDSPAVVSLVHRLIDAGRAQCIVGNHELNILLGERKQGNAWLYGEKEEVLDRSGKKVRQSPADATIRGKVLDLFRHLPLALERDDVRVVHACWEPTFIDQARRENNVVAFYRRHKEMVDAELEWKGIEDKTDRGLAHQNRNPVKMLTSGPEERLATPFYAGGKERYEGRVRWWDNYRNESYCVFGHYWRLRLDGDTDGDHPFDDSKRYEALGNGRAMCIDYSAGKRWKERLAPSFDGRFQTRLGALRHPEGVLMFDDGEQVLPN